MNISKLELLEYLSGQGLVVVNQVAGPYIDFVYEVRSVFILEEQLECGGVAFDLTGYQIEWVKNSFRYELKSFSSFSDLDKTWLFKECCFRSPQYLSFLLRTREVETGLVSVLRSEQFNRSIIGLDITWAQLPTLLREVFLKDCLKNLNWKQIRTYIEDQFGIQRVDVAVIPSWFKQGRTYRKVSQILESVE